MVSCCSCYLRTGFENMVLFQFFFVCCLMLRKIIQQKKGKNYNCLKALVYFLLLLLFVHSYVVSGSYVAYMLKVRNI